MWLICDSGSDSDLHLCLLHAAVSWEYGYVLGGEESVFNRLMLGMRSHVVTDHDLRITIRFFCNSTSDTAVQRNRIERDTTGPLRGPRPRPQDIKRRLKNAHFFLGIITSPSPFSSSPFDSDGSQSGASSCLRRLHQPRARHLLCPSFLHHERSTVLFAILCFSSAPCRELITMTHPRTGHGIFPTRGCVITPTSRWEGDTVISNNSFFLSL